MTRHLYSLVLLLSLGLLTACPSGRGGGGGDGDDDDNGADDDDVADDDDGADDDDTVPDTETSCDDGLDEDEDGLMDCEDPDCADVAPCNWPEALDHVGTVFFDGWEIECVFGVPFDYQVDDCATDYTSPLGTTLTVDRCEACDRTFEGPFTYSVDTCTELLPDASDPPDSGAFGMVFTSATEWEVFSINGETGLWESVGIATDDGSGTFVYQTEAVISGDPEECNNGEQDLGNLVVTLSFSEAP